MQKVAVVKPNGGEVIPSGGNPYTIEWTAPAQAEKFKILYSTDNGATWVLITSDATGISYDWTTVPVPTSNKNSCYVRVIGYSASNAKVGEDKSDKPFTIEGVKLIQPNGGEFLESGSSYPIQWEINGTKSSVTKVNLYYTTDGGGSYVLIESIPTIDPETRPLAMGHPWTVPTPPGNRANCYVKVVAYSNNTVVGSDRSAKPFTIGVVKLLTPNGGEVLESGSSYPIQWEINGTKYPVATVKLYCSMDGGATWALITTLDGSFRSYDWIPLVQITKTKCKIKIAMIDTRGIATGNDMSDGYFTIQP
jgi:hypothetical protein